MGDSDSNIPPTDSNKSSSTPDDSPTSDGGGNRDRNLIEAALQDVTPFDSAPGHVTDLPPADTFPGYEILREIHRGGQGVVYLALQKSAKRRVAVKVMHAGPFMGSKGRTRFEREVQILGQLNHPNIVRIHDSGVTKDGGVFYVMDYISGRTLSEFVQAKKPDLDTILKIFVKICQGVNAAHLKGVIHRDLKPANIRVDQNGEPVIVDFGLAKLAVPDSPSEGEAAHEVMSMTGQFIGSLPWASPEQAEGAHGQVDVRTDVYSLGVILYQMLTGRFPYEVIGNMRDVLDRILRAEPVKPSTVRRNIGDEIETIVLKCLRKERDRRYQSAGDLGRDLERYMQGQAIEAKSDSGWYVISKTLRRYRMPVGVGVAFLVLIAGSSVVLSVLYRQKSIAQTQALESARIAEERRVQADENASIALGLAGTMLYDFPPAIEKLVGSTQARRTLLESVQSQIAKLQDDAPSDPGLLKMLADAHELAGDLKSGLNMQSAGTLDEAAKHYESSSKIRLQLQALDPDGKAASAVARSDLRLAHVKLLRQDFKGAQELAEKATASFGAIAAKAGDSERRSARLAHLEAQLKVADCKLRRAERGDDDVLAETALQDYSRIDSEFRELFADDRADAKVARWLGVMSDKRSLALMTSASRMRSDAAKMNQAKPGSGADMLRKAAVLADQAAEFSNAAAEEFAKLSADYPKNGELKRDAWLAWYMAGSSAAESGRIAKSSDDPTAARAAWTRSLDCMDKAMLIAKELEISDPVNLEAKRDVSAVHFRRGNAHREIGLLATGDERIRSLESSMSDFRSCLSLREFIMQTDPMQQHRRDLAAALYRCGQIALELGDPAAARGFAHRSKDQLSILIEEKAMESENSELREVQALLERAGGADGVP